MLLFQNYIQHLWISDKVLRGKKLIVIAKVLGTLDRPPPFVFDVCLGRKHEDELRALAVVHLLGAAHRGERLAEAHHSIHEQILAALGNR